MWRSHGLSCSLAFCAAEMSRWLNENNVIRRIFLFVTLWMTYRAFTWASAFAATSTLDGVGQGAVIVAVTAPIAYLQKAVFEKYLESRS